MPIIPDALLESRSIHVTRIHASSEISEADNSIMMTNIDAILRGTYFEGSFTIEWCWSRVRNSYTETLVPTAIFDHEYSRSEWLTFNNNNQWIDGAKQILLDIRFVKDESYIFSEK